MGLYLLARAALVNADVPFWGQLLLLTVGIALMFHAFYLIVRYHYDRRMIRMLEMFLSDSEPSHEK